MRRFSIAAVALLLALAFTPLRAQEQVYQHFAYYDESELPGSWVESGWNMVYGVFFYPTLPVSPIFTIERMRFWHFDTNNERDPFRVHLVVRNTAAEYIFHIQTIENLWTTCTNCWEEVEIEESFWDASTPGWSYGVFMEPEGGFLTNAEPKMRMDSAVSLPLVNLYSGFNPWDNHFYNLVYLEEQIGGGDFFMEIIVRYDVTTPTAETSLSAIKALY